MTTCQIKWIDEAGQSTADTNPAIGRVMMKARVDQIGGRGVRFEASDWFNICECHAKRLGDRGMHNWVFEALEA